MPSRELHQKKAKNGRVRFVLRPDGALSESDAASELTAIVIATDPAVGPRTGRLIPDKRSAEITTSLFFASPDASGISHLGGIECAEINAQLLATHAEKKGYRVIKDV